jgi:transcription elongation factor Elf1
VLRLPCPFCQTEHADEFECLDSGHVGTLRCEGCREHFWFIFYECLACGHESVFTWKKAPTPAALTGLFCEHCGVPFSEAHREAESENATRRFQ